MSSVKAAENGDRRAKLEQVKGMLMLLYGIDANAAFNLLKWLSQESNVKLRLVAEQVAQDFCSVGERAIVSRSVFDRLLLSAPARASDPPEDSTDVTA